jgi:seryl-tRNA synthetase
MHDIRWIRENPDAFDRALAHRKGKRPASELIALDDSRRAAIAQVEEAQEKRNALSKQIGQAKAQKDEARAQALMAEVGALKEQLPALEAARKQAEEALRNALLEVPNVPAEGVPEGEDESANRPYYGRNGTAETAAKERPAKPHFLFTPKEHFELGEATGDMDFEVAAKLSGSRFVVLKSHLARLERALGQFMIDMHADEHGYTEIQPPLLVKDDALYGTNQLPKFYEDLYASYPGGALEATKLGEGTYVGRVVTREIEDPDRLWLIPTAEVALTNLVRESIISEAELPLRFTALTPCFRSEAGSAGRDTRGMIRNHQFNKVELVSITTPETSADEHERMLSCAEAVLQKLGIHYRVMELSTGDMGFGAQRTYDIEVWLPGQDTYREISSCSVCGDFQARRMDARYRDDDGKIRHVHTLNGSALAVGRTLIAVMENYQQEDGSIAVPDVLQRYMGGLTRIGGKS